MGFSLSWSLIDIGLKKSELYGFVFDTNILIDFLKMVVGETSSYENEIIELICCEQDALIVKKKVQILSKTEMDHTNSNLRKWRALLLHNKLNDLQGYHLVNLYEFWLVFDDVTPLPPFYPHDAVSFLRQNENDAIKKHIEWLNNEVQDIVFIDKKNNLSPL